MGQQLPSRERQDENLYLYVRRPHIKTPCPLEDLLTHYNTYDYNKSTSLIRKVL
jgi:hypothetical protein